MQPYVFYCSRCKADHAGECPPAATRAGTGMPAIGSLWQIQRIFSVSPTTWMKPGEGGDPKIYEVVRVSGSRCWIRVAGPGDHLSEYEYDQMPWTEDGMGSWRLVPAVLPADCTRP